MGEIDLIKSRVKELIGCHDERGTLSSFEQQEVRELSMRFLGCDVPNCNCRNVYSDYLFLILNKLNKGDFTTMASRYRLKKGVLIHVGGEVYSNANLTDDVAAAYIKKYPSNTVFEIIPKDDDQVKQDVSPIRDYDELQDLITADIDAKVKIGAIREEYTGLTLQDGSKATKEVITAMINREKEALS